MRVFLLSRAALPASSKHLGGQVLQHSGQVHGGASTDTLGVLALLQEPRNAANRELQARLRGLADGLLGRLALATTRHGCNRVLIDCWRVLLIADVVVKLLDCLGLYNRQCPVSARHSGTAER